MSSQDFALRLVSFRIEALGVVTHRHAAERARDRAGLANRLVARQANRLRVVEDPETDGPVDDDRFEGLDVPRGDAKSAHIVPAKSHSERLAQAGVLVPVVTQVVVVANVNRVAVWALFCRLRAAEKTVSTHFCHKKIVKICLFWIALNAV